ncbi:hypothetical protein ABW19_dt0203344 [Dactylella cylindrospora]|nr:hypothetical protein ABW19_dt0203344 [Dactylella cylindrospora]
MFTKTFIAIALAAAAPLSSALYMRQVDITSSSLSATSTSLSASSTLSNSTALPTSSSTSAVEALHHVVNLENLKLPSSSAANATASATSSYPTVPVAVHTPPVDAHAPPVNAEQAGPFAFLGRVLSNIGIRDVEIPPYVPPTYDTVPYNSTIPVVPVPTPVAYYDV